MAEVPNQSETAEAISPHGVGRAFGITATLSSISGLFLDLGLPRVVESFGWPAWMLITGICSLCVSRLVAFGEGPWWPERRELEQVRVPDDRVKL